MSAIVQETRTDRLDVDMLCAFVGQHTGVEWEGRKLSSRYRGMGGIIKYFRDSPIAVLWKYSRHVSYTLSFM
ncbi:Protein of unknown function [Gryllus bimaculatus]|nr:Protein of unknown function [Gryllus bimaculatus]